MLNLQRLQILRKELHQAYLEKGFIVVQCTLGNNKRSWYAHQSLKDELKEYTIFDDWFHQKQKEELIIERLTTTL